ncbi:MAG: Gfo/Idh/MocA family oxidoreductase [Pirellulales bacterium]
MNSKPSNKSATGGNRRRFLQTSSVAVAGATLASGLNIARAAHPLGDDEIKIGLIGCGGRGTGAAEDALKAPGKSKLVAMGDAFPEFLGECHKRLSKQFGDRCDVPKDRQFTGLDAYEKVLASDANYIILATPPGFRPIHFEAAINAGKHVFMEKPVAVDAPGIRRVLAAGEMAKEKGLGVGVGLQRHHDPAYIEAIKRIQDGEIGNVICTRVYWNGPGLWIRNREPDDTEMKYQVRNWYYFNWLCGDHIVEQHIHNMDVSNWLKGMVPIEAQGQGGREVRRSKACGQIFDHHFVEFTYPDGTKMISQCRHIPDCWSSVSEHAHGTAGTADVSKQEFFAPDGKLAWKYRGPTAGPYQQEHVDLQASIRKGEPINETEFGATSTMTAILGRMATYGGKVVKWDDAIASDIDLSPKVYAWDAEAPVLPDADGNYPIAVPGVTRVV